MFADNHKLSTNGIWKLLLTEETGLALLFSVYFAKRLDILTGAMILTGHCNSCRDLEQRTELMTMHGS